MMNSQNTAPYWMVHCPTQGPSRHPHNSRAAAEAEAERLARRHPGHRFFVLGTASAHMVRDPVERVVFPTASDLPF